MPKKSSRRRIGVAIVVLLGCGLAVWAGAQFHARVLADGSRLQLLKQAPSVGASSGLIHGAARVTSATAGGLPPCGVEYKKKKEWRFVTVHDGAHIAFVDGRRFTVPPGHALELFDAIAPKSPATDERKARARARVEALKDGGDADITCLSAAELVYVQGCVESADASILRACDGDDAVYLVPGGSPSALIASHAAAGAAWLSLGLLGLSLALASVWRSFCFLRPVVQDLADHARITARSSEPRDLFGYVLVFTIALAGIALMAIRGNSGFYALTMAVVLLAALFLWFLVGVRWRKLSAALRIVRTIPTGALAEAGEDLRELAVRVAAKAPAVPSLAAGSTASFVRATISEVVVVKRQKGSSELTMERAKLSHPRWLPIEDASGPAVIDMRDCLLDAVPEPPVVVTGALQLPAWAGTELKVPIAPASGHRRFEVQWMTLSPGDPLVIYGQVERIRAGAEHDMPALAEGGYRGAPVVLGVQGRTIAYQGDERQLERALRVERRAIVPLALMLLAASAATVAACVHAAGQS